MSDRIQIHTSTLDAPSYYYLFCTQITSWIDTVNRNWHSSDEFRSKSIFIDLWNRISCSAHVHQVLYHLIRWKCCRLLECKDYVSVSSKSLLRELCDFWPNALLSKLTTWFERLRKGEWVSKDLLAHFPVPFFRSSVYFIGTEFPSSLSFRYFITNGIDKFALDILVNRKFQ